MVQKQGFTYIMTNQHNKILYIGVTSNLSKRIWEHKNKVTESFTQKYKLFKLVYYEDCGDIINTILREKYLKGKSREFKIKLIESLNPDWQDLYSGVS
jgi:putative endonuclease